MKFYQKTWFIVLSLFVFAPLGLFLMWRYKPTWSKGLKGVLTGFFCIWFICIMIGSRSDTPSEPTNSDLPKAVSETYTAPTEKRTEPTTEPTTEATTEPTTEPSTEATTEAPSTTTARATESKASTGGQTQSGSNTSGSHTSQSGGQSSNKQGSGQSSNNQSTTKASTTQNRSKETTTQNPDAQAIVYITKTGKRYHNENPCGNGTYYPISLEEAKARGYTPCEKCVLH